MNLYSLSRETEDLYERLLNSLDEETGEVDGEIANALAVKEEEFNDKAVGVAVVSRRLGATVEQIDAEIQRLTAMKKRYENAQDRLINSLSDACMRLGKTKIQGIGAVISFRKSERVVIENETEIPDEFIAVKMSKRPDLTKIKGAIKAGEEVPGAKIETVQNIQIR